MSAMIRRLSLGGLVVIAMLCVAVHGWRVVANADLGVCMTPSVPVGLYALYGASKHPARGSYACLVGSSTAAPRALRAAIATGLAPSSWRHTLLLKEVVGLEGDLITYEKDLVHINGQRLPNSNIKSHDSLGQRLPAPQYPLRIGRGEVWLASSHVHGFDSRYFGPVRLEALSCEGRPLWTF